MAEAALHLEMEIETQQRPCSPKAGHQLLSTTQGAVRFHNRDGERANDHRFGL